MFAGLLSEVHRLTLAKVGAPRDGALDADAAALVEEHADRSVLSSPAPFVAAVAEGAGGGRTRLCTARRCGLALLRVIHAATLPDPGELAKMIGQGSFAAPSASVPTSHDIPQSATVQTLMPTDFQALLDRLAREGFVSLEMTLRDVVRLVEYAPPVLAYPAGRARCARICCGIARCSGEGDRHALGR